MKSNEEWSSQLCSLAQRVRAQTSHPLTKSLTKISKIRRSPRQEKWIVACPKDKLEFKFSLSPLMSLTYCHRVSYRSWSDLRFCWHLSWTSLGASFSLQKFQTILLHIQFIRVMSLENTAVWLLLTLSVVSHDKLSQRFEIAL